MSIKRPSKRRTSEQSAPAHRLHSWCRSCEKWGYFDRNSPAIKAERKRLRALDRAAGGDAPLSIYPCPADHTRWHVGHDHLRATETAGYYSERGAS